MKHDTNMPYHIVSGAGCNLYMPFEMILPSAQGMAIFDDYVYVLYHTGVCGVYDLASRDPSPVGVFYLGSYNAGIPTDNFANHANQAMFSNLHHLGNPIPLLYVTTGNGGGYNKDGYYYKCAVENITVYDGRDGQINFTAQTIQTIQYSGTGELPHRTESPCWGAPAFFVDTSGRWLYLFSARYRTTREYADLMADNAFIVTRFALPPPGFVPVVTLGPKDILEQFTTPLDILFTQGGTLYQNMIYYTFGHGGQGYPLGLRVFDLRNRQLTMGMDLSDSAFADEEIECCAVYKGRLLCNTNSGKIYTLLSDMPSR